jgi:hypothetical protein
MNFLVLTIVLALFSNYAYSLGVNCRGDHACSNNPVFDSDLNRTVTYAQLLNESIWELDLPDDYQILPGVPITCTPHKNFFGTGFKDGVMEYCFYAQRAVVTLQQMRNAIAAIINHGCKSCGSAPTNETGIDQNNVNFGEGTINLISCKSPIDAMYFTPSKTTV